MLNLLVILGLGLSLTACQTMDRYNYQPKTMKGAECLNKCTHRKSSCRESRYTQGRCQKALEQCRVTCEQIDELATQ